ncbi:MAG: M24 family metallopeptidase [Janthinobacterium lividum]
MPTRLDALRSALTTQDPAIDALLLTDIGNLSYLTGFTGSTAQVVITPDEALFITDSRYTLRAKSECVGFEIVETPAGSGGYGEALKNVLSARPALRRLGFEAGQVTVSQFDAFHALVPEMEWIATANLVETLRLVKDADEISLIKAAIVVAETAMETVKPLLTPGTREQDFAMELEFAMRRLGASGAAFDTIVASGPNGAHPHHHAGPHPLAEGDFVTIDWGATVDGYNSDITRTYVIREVTPKQREIYAIVLEAQQRAIAAIQPGRTGQEIDAVARDFIASHGYGEAFGHSLGHSLGRSVHDGPGFSVRSDKLILKPGMVLTVEPGIYLENWGGLRIEEDILVTEQACEILTHLPNALEILA